MHPPLPRAPPQALEAAVQLSHRYIADRFLPDKVGRRRGSTRRRFSPPTLCRLTELARQPLTGQLHTNQPAVPTN
jgi:hypothetical protein